MPPQGLYAVPGVGLVNPVTGAIYAPGPGGTPMPTGEKITPEPPPPPAPPTTEQKTEQPVTGDVLSVQTTTHPDRYIVRTQLEGADPGLYRQSVMSGNEIRQHGGQIPAPGEIIWGQSAGVRWAGRGARTVKTTTYPERKKIEREIEKAGGLHEYRVIQKVYRYARNPNAKEFDKLSSGTRERLDAMVEFLQGTKPDKIKEFMARHMSVGATGTEFILKSEYRKLQKNSPILARILKQRGFKAYEKELKERETPGQYITRYIVPSTKRPDKKDAKVSQPFEVLQLYTRGAYIELPDGRIIDTKAAKKMKRDSPKQYEILTTYGYAAYESAIAKAEVTLKEYKIKAGEYKIESPIFDNKAKTDAAYILFPKAIIDKIRDSYKVGPKYEGTYTERKEKREKLIERAYKVDRTPDVSDKVTGPIPLPLSENPMYNAIPKELIKKLGPLVGVATMTPVPHDDVAVYAILGVVIGGAVVYISIKNFIDKFGRSPKPHEIMFIGKDGTVATATQVRLDPKSLEQIIPPARPRGGEEVIPEKIDRKAAELIPPYIKKEMERILPQRNQAAVLITPPVTVKDLLGDKGLITAAINEHAAMNRTVTTIPVNYEKILDDVRAQRFSKALDEINAAIDRANKANDNESTNKLKSVKKKYNSAYKEYLEKQAILNAAWNQHIASNRPEPIKGSLSKDVIASYLAHHPVYYGAYPMRMSSVINEYTDMYDDRYALELEAAQRTMTELQAQQQAHTKALSQTKIAIRLAEKQATKMATRAATRTATAARTITSARTAVAPIARVATKTATTTRATTRPISPLRLPKGDMTDRGKRRIIKNANGAIAWRMGQLHGKDRWDVIINPYSSNEHYYMVLGGAPEGAVRFAKGPRSAYQTAQMIRGKPPRRKVHVDSGITDIHLSASGRRIKMHAKPDPEQETTGDITIGGGKPRISGRRFPRLTPRLKGRL